MTALVYLAIIALWALFLIPWLGRQRDEQNGRRSGERYNTAMRELRNRHAEHHETTDVEPASDPAEDFQWAPEVESAASRWDGAASRLAALRPRRRAGRKQKSRAARRRRTVLALIATGLLASVLGVVRGMLPAPVPAVFAVLLGLYLAALAGQSRRARSAASAGSAAETARHREAARLAQLQAQAMMGAGRRPEQPVASQWDAQPTHIPAYASRSKASKAPRVMDPIRGDETWTGQDMVARAQEMKRQARLAQEQFEREIAVVEPDPVAEVARLANLAEVEHYRRAANG